MKNNRINLLLIAFAVIMQRVLFQTLDFESYEFPFASSLMIFQSQTGNLLIILYTFLPIPFILFEFSGMVHELMEGYGKLWIIRAYRKDRLYMKTMIYNPLIRLSAYRVCPNDLPSLSFHSGTQLSITNFSAMFYSP